MNVCRICLSSGPSKDIFESYLDESSPIENSYVNIIKFCLDIQITKHTTATKLCTSCVTKLVTFYEFKTLALKNDTFFQTLHEDVVKLEDNFCENTELIELRGSSYCNDDTIKEEENDVLDIKYEEVEYLESDDNLDVANEITTQKVSGKQESELKPITKEKTEELNTKTNCKECGKDVKNIRMHICSHLKKSTDNKFPCKECSKVFANPYSRKRHINSIHLGIKSICKICNKAVSILSTHMQVTHNKASLRHACPVCARRYYSASELHTHMHSHTHMRPFQCDECSKDFARKSLLENHIRSIHLKERTFVCKVCSKGFFKKYHLQRHLESHTKDTPNLESDFSATNDITTLKDSKMQESIPNSIREAKTKTICEECGKAVKNIKRHFCSHLKKATDKKFPCEQCSKVFATPFSRIKHVNTIHLGIKSVCKICNKEVSYLSHHMQVTHNKASMRHACPVCARRYYSPSELKTHMHSHTHTRPFQCDECSKGFARKFLLQNHIRSIHMKERSFLCQVCSKGFFKHHHLKEHLKCHTKELPYKCEECNKRFARKSSLQSHQLLHSGEKNIECPHCDMTFYKMAYLKSHMVTHTKEKKHICRYCGAKFARGDYRKDHEFTAHQKHFLTSTTLSNKKDEGKN